MRHIEDAVNNPNFGIISISIDPTNDTPEVLKNHAAMMGLNLQTGIFLQVTGIISEKLQISLIFM